MTLVDHKSSSLRIELAARRTLLAALVLAAACHGGDGTTNPMDPPTQYPDPTKKAGMTWYKDVLPIVQDHCQGCHTTGGIAPFPLLTYSDAQAKAPQMSAAVVSRYMPPWMPSDSCQSFASSRRLTEDQIDTIYSWVADSAPEGNPADAPPPGTPPATLPWVDKTLDGGSSYLPNGAVTDDYHCFVLNPMLASDQTLIGYDFVPGVRSQVHHVLIYAGSLSEAQGKDSQTPEAGYTCYGGPDITDPQLVAAWVPGSSATEFPTNTGVPIKAGAGLVMQIHYNLQNGAPQADRSALKLQFAKTPVLRPALITPLAQQNFTIPPTSTGYSAKNSLTVPNNITLWGLAPHMHTLGREARIEMVAPGASASTCLIDIPKWDFHWQQLYFYAGTSGIPVAANTKVTLTCTWDNPGSSPVSWGESTSDEMCINYFYVTQ